MKNLIMTMGIMILFGLLLKFQTELNIIFVQNTQMSIVNAKKIENLFL